MQISTWIDQMQRFVKDFPILTRETWDGDGTTLAYRTSNHPILENSYTVKVSDVVKTETTHYTLDKDIGLLQFTAGNAPADSDDNISIDYKYANIRDEDWIEVYNNVMRTIRDDLYLETIDTSSLTTVADQNEYDLDDISTNIIDIIGVEYRSNASYPWTEVGELGMNWKYLEQYNQLQLKPYFDTSGYAIKLHYIYGFDEVSATTDDVDVPNKWLNVLKLFAAAEYLDRIIPDKLTETAVVTKERTYHPADTVAKLSEYYRGKAERELAKVRPPKRAKFIQTKA
jgi:hypothetical protein